MCRTELSGTTDFNPRPPRGGRQPLIRLYNPDNKISIHALREESDQRSTGMEPDAEYFNPRPPRGERRTAFSTNSSSRLFQSTPSARRATQAIMQGVYNHIISIHALREEGDALWACFRCAACLFQSTPSARRATNEAHFNQVPNLISIHALREESDV